MFAFVFPFINVLIFFPDYMYVLLLTTEKNKDSLENNYCFLLSDITFLLVCSLKRITCISSFINYCTGYYKAIKRNIGLIPASKDLNI